MRTRTPARTTWTNSSLCNNSLQLAEFEKWVFGFLVTIDFLSKIVVAGMAEVLSVLAVWGLTAPTGNLDGWLQRRSRKKGSLVIVLSYWLSILKWRRVTQYLYIQLNVLELNPIKLTAAINSAKWCYKYRSCCDTNGGGSQSSCLNLPDPLNNNPADNWQFPRNKQQRRSRYLMMARGPVLQLWLMSAHKHSLHSG